MEKIGSDSGELLIVASLWIGTERLASNENPVIRAAINACNEADVATTNSKIFK